MNLVIKLNELNNYNLLLKYGFNKINEYYIYEIDLTDDLYLQIKLNDKEKNIRVIDRNFSDDYLPFINNIDGVYSSFIENKVNDIINDIVDKCTLKNNLVEDLKKHLFEKYNTILEYPWEDTPDCFTAKVNNKWYLLYMKVKYKSLGIESDDLVDIINIKLDPVLIDKLIDNQNYFKAYHMNKKYWITILLKNNLDVIYELIDKSYNIVKK